LLDLRAFLLGISALLLAVSALAKRLELACHLFDSPSEIGQLAGDNRCVLSVWHVLAGFYVYRFESVVLVATLALIP
jgi:hypothetical protein